jgi:hypothetical protein
MSLWRPAAHNHHVQFYNDDGYMCAIVAAYLGDGLRVRHSAVAIVTPEHRALITRYLESQGFDVDHALLTGLVVFQDA